MSMGFCLVLACCWNISVGRVLFLWVLEIMLSGLRLLLSALALGMCVFSLVVDPPVLFLLCLSPLFALLAVSLFLFFCHLVSILLFP